MQELKTRPITKKPIIKIKKEFVTWAQVEEYTNKVASMYLKENIKGVYGVPRGGLVLAVILSHKMHIPLLAAPCDDCIIVDDIADTGKTLLYYAQKDSYNITTMFYCKKSLVTPDYWYKEKKNYWIVYPWEVK